MLKNIWFWGAAFFFAGVLIVGLAPWKSYPPRKEVVSDSKAFSENKAELEVQVPAIEGGSEKQDDQEAINPAFPAPAKKLQRLIGEAESSVEAAEMALSERMDNVDQNITAINERLTGEGLPAESAPREAFSSKSSQKESVEERLSRIKAFIKEKEQQD